MLDVDAEMARCGELEFRFNVDLGTKVFPDRNVSKNCPSLQRHLMSISCVTSPNSHNLWNIREESLIMSRASKMTLLGTSVFAVATVFFVHFQQNAEKAVCSALQGFTGLDMG